MSRSVVYFFSTATILAAGGAVSCSADDGGGSGGSGYGGASFGGGGGGAGGTAPGGGGGGMAGGMGGGMDGGGMGGGMGGGGMGGGGMGGSGMGGSGGDTCKTPTKLHPPKADAGTSNIYCPFSGADGGMNDYCVSGSEHCCEPKAFGSVSKCQALSQPCATGDTDWQCQDPVADCPTGQKCCGTGTVVKNTDPLCANYATGFTGTKCASSCGSGEVEICTADAQCASPETCLPFGAKGAQVGACY